MLAPLGPISISARLASGCGSPIRSARTHFHIRSPRLRLRLAHQIDGIPHTASCPEGLGLDGVAEPDAPGGAVPHGAAHLLHHVGAGQHDVGDPVAAEQVELVREERDIEQRDDGLGARQRERAESRALAPGQDDGGYALGVQGSASPINMTGIPSRTG